MLCDIAASFLHNPKIIFLDEPTIGLDVSIKNKIRMLIRELNKEKNTTIILTSHDIGDIEALCKRIIMIDKGKLVFDGKTDVFKKQYGSLRTLNILFQEENEQISKCVFQDLYKNFESLSISKNEENAGWYSIIVDENKEILSNILSYIMERFPIKDIQIEETNIESILEKMYLHKL